MKFSIYLTIVLTFLLISTSLSQVNTNSGLVFTETAAFYKKSNDLSDIKGSPYVNDIFTQAVISPLEKMFLVRYNAVIDEIEVSLENDKILALDKYKENYIITFNKDQKKYVILDNNGELEYYVEMKKLDKLSLYKKEKKVYHPKEEANSSYQKEKPAYFSDLKVSYYININSENNKLLEFSNNKNSLLKLFPNYKNDLKTFLKKEKNNLKDENDIIKAVTHLNGLL
jgi:hypothetical protein